MIKKLKIIAAAITLVAGMVLFTSAATDGITPITVVVLLVVGCVLMYVGARTAVHFYNEEEKGELSHEEFKKWLTYKRQAILLEIEFRTNSPEMLREAELKLAGKPNSWDSMTREIMELEAQEKVVYEMLEGM